ncbi:MAG: carbohydrate ABC transporter substrate-binding protein [Ruminococcus sp.]|nr:carbohydrate ABC transporter substrate-binding protein [Ruminococcus sp.]
MRNRTILPLRAAAMLTAAAVLCSSCMARRVNKVDEKVSISFSWWGNDTRNEATVDALSVFREKYGISVDAHYSEFSGFKANMDAQFRSGTECDVMQINYDWLYEYSPDGRGFYDLNELSDYISLDAFTEYSLGTGTVNGVLNGLPTGLNAITFIYNKDIYDSYGLDIPETWEDLFKAAEVMKKDQIYPLSLTDKNFFICACAYVEQVTGRSPWGSDWKPQFTEEDCLLMLEFYDRLTSEKVSAPGKSFERSNFTDWKIAGLTSWASDMQTFEEMRQEGAHIVIGSYLTTENSLACGWYVKPVSLICIKKSTEHPEEAAMLADFSVNSAEMSALIGTSRGIPASLPAKETLESRDMLHGMEAEAAALIYETGELEVMSPYLERSELIGAYTDSCERVYYKESTPAEEAAALCEALNGALV